MRRIDFLDVDIQVAIVDLGRKQQRIASECMKVWDSMSGKLPSFQSFCEMYMRERMEGLIGKVRWN